ncbi:MAG TPA: VWA domain-containing protein [Dongiaceae bacterium]|nr:VWA domain-containing protein [Dongiaceae bacterium]
MGQGIGMNQRVSYRKWGRQSGRLAAVLMLAGSTATARAQDSGTATPQSATVSSSTALKTSDTPAKSANNTSTENKTEVSSRDTGTTFKLRVNVVQVRVVVRDPHGKPVGGLKREDFLLYDQGKLQTVSTFGVETEKTRLERAELAAKTQQASDEGPAEERVVMPQRFVALVFDDIHLQMQDAISVRLAAKKLIEGMLPTDRVAIFATSEQIKRDFTGDRQALEDTLMSLVPRPKMGGTADPTGCPDVNHYMADQYFNKGDPQVLQVVTQDVLDCMYGGDQRELAAAQAQAQSALQIALTTGDTDNDFTYRALEDFIRRLSGMPGEKILVLAGPGFLLTTQQQQETGIIDRANKANVVINTLDARGLYTPDLGGDIASRTSDTYKTIGIKNTYRLSQQSENSYVMMDIAYGTGGTFFHNSNDLAGGFQKAASSPEVCYVLGFSPQNQKMDGRYHSIKVAMASKAVKYEIQARRGYFAPRKVEDPQEQAKQEIAEAVFSQEEIHELSVDLQTQYFKLQSADAKLSVVSRIDLKGMHFRKENGRNWDNLTVATVIFDENGNFVTGGEKLLEMRLLDTTYDKLSRTGLTMKSSFDLKPGKYVVRQVVRDSEGAQMAARNGAVVIPY